MIGDFQLRNDVVCSTLQMAVTTYNTSLPAPERYKNGWDILF